MKYKVRFIEDAIIHKSAAPKGGFVTEIIAKGTEMIVSVPSLNYWKVRKKIVVIDRVEDEPATISETVKPIFVEPMKSIVKAPIKRAIEAAKTALDNASLENFRVALKEMEGSVTLFAEMPDDLREQLFYMIDDAVAGADITSHLADASSILQEAAIALMPPSQRQRYGR